MKKKNKREQLLEQNLELVRSFLLEAVRHPHKVAHIPPDATVILYPVEQKKRKVA